MGGVFLVTASSCSRENHRFRYGDGPRPISSIMLSKPMSVAAVSHNWCSSLDTKCCGTSCELQC